jgi:hypothetical protein
MLLPLLVPNMCAMRRNAAPITEPAAERAERGLVPTVPPSASSPSSKPAASPLYLLVEWQGLCARAPTLM